MPLEYEYRYKDGSFDRKKIILKLKKLKAVKQGHWIFRVQVFIHPLEKLNTYVRVRDEGYRITMTFKSNMDEKFANEHEVQINNFNEGCNILLGLGCTKKYYYEKMREIWHIGETEICWDTNPGRPDIMEIESKTKKELEKTVKLLGLEGVSHDDFTDTNLYKETFGIIIPKSLDLKFETAKKNLGKFCTKNKKIFNKLVDDQNKLFEQLKKDNTVSTVSGGAKNKYYMKYLYYKHLYKHLKIIKIDKLNYYETHIK